MSYHLFLSIKALNCLASCCVNFYIYIVVVSEWWCWWAVWIYETWKRLTSHEENNTEKYKRSHLMERFIKLYVCRLPPCSTQHLSHASCFGAMGDVPLTFNRKKMSCVTSSDIGQKAMPRASGCFHVKSFLNEPNSVILKALHAPFYTLIYPKILKGEWRQPPPEFVDLSV